MTIRFISILVFTSLIFSSPRTEASNVRRCLKIATVVATLATTVGVVHQMVSNKAPVTIVVDANGKPVATKGEETVVYVDPATLSVEKDPEAAKYLKVEGWTTLPRNFTLKKFGDQKQARFQLMNNGFPFGNLEDTGSVRDLIEVTDKNGHLVAKGSENLTMGYTFTDAKGETLAIMEKNIQTSFLVPGEVFKLLDKDKRIIGFYFVTIDKKTGAREIQLKGNGNMKKTLISYKQAGFPKDPDWTVTIIEPNSGDPRVNVLVPLLLAKKG